MRASRRLRACKRGGGREVGTGRRLEGTVREEGQDAEPGARDVARWPGRRASHSQSSSEFVCQIQRWRTDFVETLPAVGSATHKAQPEHICHITCLEWRRTVLTVCEAVALPNHSAVQEVCRTWCCAVLCCSVASITFDGCDVGTYSTQVLLEAQRTCLD